MNQSLIDSQALERGLRRCWRALVSGVSVWGSEKVAERVGDKGFEIIADLSPRSSGYPVFFFGHGGPPPKTMH